MSEYLGIRLAMLDGLQRYYDTPNHDKLDPHKKAQLLEVLVKQACVEDNLLGDRKEVIGNAWAEFIGSRSPDAVAKFVENADIKHMATTLPKLAPMAKTMTNAQAAGLVTSNIRTLKPMVTGFEDIAQSAGLIDYKHGDTLSGEITKYAGLGKDKDLPRQAEMPGTAALIKQLFDSHNGEVKDSALGIHHNPQAHIEGAVSLKQAAGNLVTALPKLLGEAISAKGNAYEYGPMTPSKGHVVFDSPGHIEGAVSWGQAAENLATVLPKLLSEAISAKSNAYDYGPVVPSKGHVVFDQAAPATPAVPGGQSQKSRH